ncbi:unnamed protein product [Nezara viridula]|uniref:Uncharacterized protein n=1 Tax=Nezara viridula TaxID=85310 RepID=A0A9P0HCQ7_NEZVI|nr:unnamed protein product [Nezara viridula]
MSYDLDEIPAGSLISVAFPAVYFCSVPLPALTSLSNILNIARQSCPQGRGSDKRNLGVAWNRGVPNELALWTGVAAVITSPASTIRASELAIFRHFGGGWRGLPSIPGHCHCNLYCRFLKSVVVKNNHLSCYLNLVPKLIMP